MYMRFLHLKVKVTDPDVVSSFYDNTVIPELQKINGCLFACLIQNNKLTDDYISLTIWDSKIVAENYEKCEAYKKLHIRFEPLLAESSEWKIQLTEDLELQYKPVKEKPQVKDYSVAIKSTDVKEIEPSILNRMFLRLVSMKLEKNKIDKFKKIYENEIIPALQKTNGCSYAYLVESTRKIDEVVSITIWENKKSADNYESSGRYDELLNKLKPTLSKFYQWKMALERDISGKLKTSEDLKLSEYSMVSGKSFN
jgi:quinol monooxygenase YgiN